jgi:oligopeptide transport system permease protein
MKIKYYSSVLFLISLGLISASAATPVSDFTYKIREGKVTILSYKGSEPNVEIPATIEDTPVLIIGSNAFREGMITALQSDFIITARAKGLSDFSIYFKHALRLGILPLLSYSGPLLADLLTGSFIVENIFQIPGIGVFMVNSSLNRDYTMVVGLTLVYSVLLLILNLLVDILYSYLDPRIKLQ